MTYIYVDELNIGDTIFVSGQNNLQLGFFAGKGKGTIQFYRIWAVLKAKEREKAGGNPKMYKDYVGETNQWRIAKVKDPIFRDKEEQHKYEEAKQYLIEKGIIKNC